MAVTLMNMSDPDAPTPPGTPSLGPRRTIPRNLCLRDEDVIDYKGPEDDHLTVSTNPAQAPIPMPWTSLQAIASEYEFICILPHFANHQNDCVTVMSFVQSTGAT